jgi:hypothetical protein
MNEELYEVEARDLLQKGLAWSDDHPLYNHIYLHNHFPRLIQLDTLPRH